MRLLLIRGLVVLLLAPLVAGTFAGRATAQVETREGLALRNQIWELQQQVQDLRQQVQQRQGGGSYLGQPYSTPQAQGGGNDMVAQLLARVQTLEEQVRELRGKIAETQNQLEQQNAALNKRIDDLTFQLQNPQAGGAAPMPGGGPGGPGQAGGPSGGAPGVPPPTALGTSPSLGSSPPPTNLGSMPAGARPPVPPTPPATPVRRTPELAMQEGQAALARRDYQAAEAAARDVLQNYRTSPRAYDAQFLLAQALAGERQFPSAAIAYDDTYNRSRKGTHAPEALLGLSNALVAINEKKAACDTLTKLRTEFPQAARGELREPAAAAHQRAGCH